MEYISQYKWRNIYRIANIEKFFVESWIEMTDKTTIDSYRPKIMNLKSVLEELLDYLEETINGQDRFKHYVEEINEELKLTFEREKSLYSNDPVLINELTKIINKLTGFSHRNTQQINDAKPQLVVLKGITKKVSSEYQKRIIEAIQEELINGRNEQQLFSYMSSYLSELLYSGHSVKHLFFCKLPLLEWNKLHGTWKKDFKTRLNRVFKSLSVQKEWVVYFKLYSRNEIDKAYPKVVNNIDFFDGPLSIEDKNIPEEFKEVDKNIRYAKVTVTSSDPHRATLEARFMLEVIMDIIGFSIVDQHLEILHQAYIPNYGERLESTLPQLYDMKLSTDFDYKRLLGTMRKIQRNGTKRETIHRLHSSLSFYRIGITSGSSQVAYMNFWTALEFFITGNKANVNIRDTFDSLSILLSLNYMTSLVGDLLKNIIKLKTPDLPGEKPWQEFEPYEFLQFLRDAMKVQSLKSLVTSELLKYRINDIIQRTSTNTKIHESLSAHQQRIRWQISRLYRKRNLLAHEANSSNINMLLPNLHGYLFTTIENVLKIIERTNGEMSIEEIMSRVKYWQLEVDSILQGDSTNTFDSKPYFKALELLT